VSKENARRRIRPERPNSVSCGHLLTCHLFNFADGKIRAGDR
jgi:hypothetical protein